MPPPDQPRFSDLSVAHKRESERVPIPDELRGEVMLFQPLSVREISEGGVLIETAFSLQLDSLHDFRLTLGDRSIVIKGRVAHSAVSDVAQEFVTYRSGIQFIEPTERVASVIRDFIGAVKARQITSL